MATVLIFLRGGINILSFDDNATQTTTRNHPGVACRVTVRTGLGIITCMKLSSLSYGHIDKGFPHSDHVAARQFRYTSKTKVQCLPPSCEHSFTNRLRFCTTKPGDNLTQTQLRSPRNYNIDRHTSQPADFKATTFNKQ